MNNNLENKSWQFICSCHSYEHQINFDWDEDDQQLIVSIHLSSFPFWKRLTNGLKYIFGYKCKFGEFEEIILNPSQISANAFRKISELLKP